jgi:hypothetical protein
MKLTAFFATLILCFLPAKLSRPAAATGTHTTNTVYLFVEIETKVHRAGVQTSSENPNERRFYLSNVVVQPEDVPSYSLVKQKIVPYFSRNVMDPAEKRGILIDYGELDVRVNGESSYANYESREKADEQRNKAIEYRKGQSANIYSFELVWGPANGEETSKPKLIYREKGTPNYESVK